MNVIESVERRENDSRIRLTCAHWIITTDPHVCPGARFDCPECPNFGLLTPGSHAKASPEQLDAITADYVATMRKRGFVLGEPEVAACRRAAGIQDAWRVAFARALGK